MTGEHTEQWRAIPGFPDYLASNTGRIYSKPRTLSRKDGTTWKVGDRILTLTLNKKRGYLYVRVVDGEGRRRYPTVHSLIAAAFIGTRPDGAQTCHNDGDALNNRADNLRYDTPAENTLDVVRHGHHRNVNKTKCPKGHPYSGDNLRISRRGNGREFRICRTCKSANDEAYRARASHCLPEHEIADRMTREDHS